MSKPSDLPEPRGIILEVGAWFIVLAILLYIGSILVAVGNFAGDIGGSLPPAFCLIFPVVAAGRRGVTLEAMGLGRMHWGRALAAVGIASIVIFPLFVVGYDVWLKLSGELPGRLLAAYSKAPVISAAWLVNLVFVQVFAVALPEEVFYRGWMQARLGIVFKTRFRVPGADVGLHVVVTAALFAVSHLVVTPSPARLAVFFPGLLFGYLRERTGSVAAPAIFHALCNIALALVQQFHLRTPPI